MRTNFFSSAAMAIRVEEVGLHLFASSVDFEAQTAA